MTEANKKNKKNQKNQWVSRARWMVYGSLILAVVILAALTVRPKLPEQAREPSEVMQPLVDSYRIVTPARPTTSVTTPDEQRQLETVALTNQFLNDGFYRDWRLESDRVHVMANHTELTARIKAWIDQGGPSLADMSCPGMLPASSAATRGRRGLRGA